MRTRFSGPTRRLVAAVAAAATATALVVGGPVGAATAAPDDTITATATTSGGDRRELQRGVDELHDLGITGVQALLRDSQRDTWARAGVADRDTGRPMPHNAHFRIGSNTKTFAAVITLQLVGEGRLSLDDTVDEWLPGVVSGNGNDGRRITIRQLLQHTSGLFNYTAGLVVLSTEEAFLEHRYDSYEPEELVAIAMKHEPNFAPGSAWSYSNTNYILIGMVIEEITGRSWATEVRERITKPLGLTQTFSPGDRPTLPRPYAKGYQQFEPAGPLVDTTDWNTTAAYAAGDLVSTPADLTRFWQALLGGRLLKPAQMKQMRRTVPATEFGDVLPGAGYGLGIMRLPLSCGDVWAHGGDVPGMSTVNGVTPDGRRAVVASLHTQLAGDEAAAPVFLRGLRLVDEAVCGGRG